MDIGNFIVGIIGACEWIPILIEYTRKQKFGFSLVHCNPLKNFKIRHGTKSKIWTIFSFRIQHCFIKQDL